VAALDGDPAFVGSVAIPRLAGLRAYPLRLARLRVEPGQRVGTPRHLRIYGVAEDGVVEILGLAHDRMVRSRAARKVARAAGAERGAASTGET